MFYLMRCKANFRWDNKVISIISQILYNQITWNILRFYLACVLPLCLDEPVSDVISTKVTRLYLLSVISSFSVCVLLALGVSNTMSSRQSDQNEACYLKSESFLGHDITRSVATIPHNLNALFRPRLLI